MKSFLWCALVLLLTLAPAWGDKQTPAPTADGATNSGFFLLIRVFPPGATVYRPIASDKANLQAVANTSAEPIFIPANSPKEEPWEIGGPLMPGEKHPSSYWGYDFMLCDVKLDKGKHGAVHNYGGKQVYFFPLVNQPELELPPASGIKNWLLRKVFFFKYHWFLSMMLVITPAVLFVIYLGYRPQLLEKQEQERRRTELNQKFETFDPDSDPYLNRSFSKWRTVERLGQGGMATVYRAIPWDTLSDEDSVAIKIMHQELLKDRDYRRRFEREIEISQSLDHPHVVRPIDWDERQGVLFLVMEYVKGKPLRDLIPNKKGFPITKALQISIDIISALVYAHNKGIVHRDLKPENIMVTDKGLVKVMDLGLAKRPESENVTRTGDTFGTPAYMAPEQIAGGGALLAATDQYAMGIIIYELLLGLRPFVADDTLTLVLKHLNEAPPRVRTVAPQLPQELDDLIDRMLAKDPSQRFSNMAEVKKRLEAILKKFD